MGGAGYQQIALSTDDIFSFVEAARGRGVFHDRIRDGEFLHIYTPNFRGGLLFEIVQRENYDLIGAANTPVRIATQDSPDEVEAGVVVDAGL